MAKLTLTDVGNLQNEGSAVNTINNNSTATEVALENTLSRDGTSPNQMVADLDMNSNQILNCPFATTAGEPTLAQYNASAVRFDIVQSLTAGQQQQARDNIGSGAGGGGGGGGSVSSVFGRSGVVTADIGDYTVAQVTGAAPLASPTFTGVPAAPTAAPGTNNTQLATTAFVQAAAGGGGAVSSVFARSGAVVAVAGDYTATQITNTPAGGIAAITVQAAITELDTEKANLASPTFTGVPAAPTAAGGTNSTQIATTSFVTTAGNLKADLASPTFTGVPAAPTAAASTNTTQIATTAFVDTSFVKTPATNTADNVPQWNGANSKTLKNGLTVGTGANNLIQLNGSSQLPAVDGSLLTGISAASTTNFNCGILARSSATLLTFTPYNGDRIKINGTVFAIPTAGIAGLANTSVFVNGTGASNLAASTLYYVYAFSNAGTVTADFSTTSHATSTTAGNVGVEIKSADNTRTLIGMIRTNGSSQFVNSTSQRFVLNWFNKKEIVARANYTTDRAVTGATFTENNAELQPEILVWSGDPIHIFMNGVGAVTSGVGTIYVALTTDNTAIVSSAEGQSAGTSAAAGYSFFVACSMVSYLSEGYHFAQVFSKANAGGVTVTLGGGGGGVTSFPDTRTYLYAKVLG